MRILRAGEAAPMPWKNGGGVTRELLRLPRPGHPPEDWLLRVSLADIDADGPFSSFPGVSRSFAVLSGHGVELSWPRPEGAVRCRVLAGGEVLEFDGGDAPHCALIDGPTRDLNVMTLTAAAETQTRRATFGIGHTWQGDARGVFARCALRLVQGHRRIDLPASSLVWSDTPDPSAWCLEPLSTEDARTVDTGSAMPPAYWIGVRLR